MDKTTRPIASPSIAEHAPRPHVPGVGTPKQRAMAELASSYGGGMQMARSLLSSATAGGGDPLPYQAQLQSSLGMDLSFITVHTGQEDVLQALGAEGAGEHEHHEDKEHHEDVDKLGRVGDTPEYLVRPD